MTEQKPNLIFEETGYFGQDSMFVKGQYKISKDTLRHGFISMYHENYDCYSLAEYRNDTLNGFTITYDCNYPIEIGFITDHAANGVFFEFERDGSIIREIRYNNGIALDTTRVWKLEK